MAIDRISAARDQRSVALVDGDAGVRHARQLLLSSENYEVRSYATCAALLADSRSRRNSCIVVDVGMRDSDGLTFLRDMRAAGWSGQAILLDGDDLDGSLAAEAGSNGDKVFDSAISDRSLLTAIAGSFPRSGLVIGSLI